MHLIARGAEGGEQGEGGGNVQAHAHTRSTHAQAPTSKGTTAHRGNRRGKGDKEEEREHKRATKEEELGPQVWQRAGLGAGSHLQVSKRS